MIENVSNGEVDTLFWNPYPMLSSLTALIGYLQTKYSDSVNISWSAFVSLSVYCHNVGCFRDVLLWLFSKIQNQFMSGDYSLH